MAPSGCCRTTQSIDPLLQALMLDKALYELDVRAEQSPGLGPDPADRDLEAHLASEPARVQKLRWRSGLHAVARASISRRQTRFETSR